MTTSTKTMLPVSRVNTIMKSCAEVEIVSKESSQLMAKAAEIFIKTLAEEGYGKTNKGKKLDYKNLTEVVHNDERYEFLREIMPRKITVAQYKKIIGMKDESVKTENGEASSSSSSSEDEDSSSGEDDSDNSEGSVKE